MKKAKSTNLITKKLILILIAMSFLDYFKKNQNHVNIEGEENLIDIKKNSPVIFVSGHFANFELMSMEITKKNISDICRISEVTINKCCKIIEEKDHLFNKMFDDCEGNSNQ